MDQEIVTICAPNWDNFNSYGNIATHLRDYLKRQDYFVNEIGENKTQDKFIPITGGIYLGYPDNLTDDYGLLPSLGRKILITMFESDKLPKTWKENLESVDSIVLPSKFCVGVFENMGWNYNKLLEIPLGVDDLFYDRFSQRDHTDRPITFLAFADGNRRKGWNIALQAFITAFGKREDVKLILKCKMNTLPFNLVSTYPNVEVNQKALTQNELIDLYLSCDVLLNPTMGEGFGLLPREFTATGGAAFSTNWGSTSEEIKNWGFPIEQYQLIPAWPYHHEFEGLGHWALPDVDYLIDMMKDYVMSPEKYLVLAEYNAAFIHNYYRWDSFCNLVQDQWYDNRSKTKILS